MLWLPVNVPAQHIFATAPDELEETIAWPHVPATIGLHYQRRSRPADTRINYGEKNSPLGKPKRIGSEQVGRSLDVADWRVGQEVNYGRAGCHLVQHCLHLACIGAVQSEVREEHNHSNSLPLAVPASCQDRKQVCRLSSHKEAWRGRRSHLAHDWGACACARAVTSATLHQRVRQRTSSQATHGCRYPGADLWRSVPQPVRGEAPGPTFLPTQRTQECGRSGKSVACRHTSKTA